MLPRIMGLFEKRAAASRRDAAAAKEEQRDALDEEKATDIWTAEVPWQDPVPPQEEGELTRFATDLQRAHGQHLPTPRASMRQFKKRTAEQAALALPAVHWLTTERSKLPQPGTLSFRALPSRQKSKVVKALARRRQRDRVKAKKEAQRKQPLEDAPLELVPMKSLGEPAHGQPVSERESALLAQVAELESRVADAAAVRLAEAEDRARAERQMQARLKLAEAEAAAWSDSLTREQLARNALHNALQAERWDGQQRTYEAKQHAQAVEQRAVAEAATEKRWHKHAVGWLQRDVAEGLERERRLAKVAASQGLLDFFYRLNHGVFIAKINRWMELCKNADGAAVPFAEYLTAKQLTAMRALESSLGLQSTLGECTFKLFASSPLAGSKPDPFSSGSLAGTMLANDTAEARLGRLPDRTLLLENVQVITLAEMEKIVSADGAIKPPYADDLIAHGSAAGMTHVMWCSKPRLADPITVDEMAAMPYRASHNPLHSTRR